MKKFKFLEGITFADYAYEAYGKNEKELFENAAFGLINSMVDPKTVKSKKRKEIKLENKEIEKLLFDFLEEIIYYKDADNMVFCSTKVSIKKDSTFHLIAILNGEEIDQKKHKLGIDVKAVTYHNYNVEKTKRGWKATIVLDV
ncbi:archease [Candidatus Woesearchaeota archaeon]|nr:archease [Candidatus Woesearchaeota archaeon]